MVAQLQEVTLLKAYHVQKDEHQAQVSNNLTQEETLEELLFKAQHAGEDSAVAQKTAEQLMSFAATATPDDIKRIRPALEAHVAATFHAHADKAASVGDTDPYSPTGGGGTVDQAWYWLEKIQNSPNDPTAVEGLLNFLIGLSPSDASNPDLQKMLSAYGISPSGGGNLQNMIDEVIMYKYFTSITSDQTDTGLAGAQAFIAKLEQMINGQGTNPYSSAMLSAINGFNLSGFDASVYQGPGKGYVWNTPACNQPPMLILPTQITWDINNPSDPNNFLIMEMIGNCQPWQGGQSALSPNPYALPSDQFNSLWHGYLTDGVNAIWNQTHNVSLLVMYFMSIADNSYQNQEGGLGNVTNLLTGATNSYASPLLAIAQKIGNLTPADAQNFVNQLVGGTLLVNIEGGMSGISSDWNQNVYTSIAGIQVTVNGQTVGLNALINNCLLAPGDPTALSNLAQGLNSLNPPPPSGGTTPPTPNPSFQALLSSVQQGGSLITGTSKTVNTELSTVANTDNQVIKLGNSFASADGGGLMAMINQIINNCSPKI